MVVYESLIFFKGISMGMLEGIWGVIMSYPFYGCMGYNGYQCGFYGTYDHQSDMRVCLKMGYTPAMAVF
jgi:hypothetical protein